jgi:hypothetical protein
VGDEIKNKGLDGGQGVPCINTKGDTKKQSLYKYKGSEKTVADTVCVGFSRLGRGGKNGKIRGSFIKYLVEPARPHHVTSRTS